MKKIFFVVSLISLLNIIFASDILPINNKENQMENVHEFVVKDMNGKDVKLSDFKGKVLLIVNVASKCGYTKQYTGLQNIYEKYKEQGFEILAFPCNDFGGQEPGSNEQIQEFCSANFDITFQLFDKIKVLGNEKSPLYSMLTTNSSVESGDIKWNFEKFLIAKNGNVIERFKSSVEPESDDLMNAIESQLKK